MQKNMIIDRSDKHTIKPIFKCLLLAANIFPGALGEYPCSSAICFTILLVSALTPVRLFNTRSTVPLDTPASFAISLIVIIIKPFILAAYKEAAFFYQYTIELTTVHTLNYAKTIKIVFES